MLLPFRENLGWIFQKYDNNRQINLIFMILTYADLVQSKKNTDLNLSPRSSNRTLEK